MTTGWRSYVALIGPETVEVVDAMDLTTQGSIKMKSQVTDCECLLCSTDVKLLTMNTCPLADGISASRELCYRVGARSKGCAACG